MDDLVRYRLFVFLSILFLFFFSLLFYSILFYFERVCILSVIYYRVVLLLMCVRGGTVPVVT